jgi:hypothetical protein
VTDAGLHIADCGLQIEHTTICSLQYSGERRAG